MPGHLKEEQLQKIQNVQQQKMQHQATIREHLTQLQSWDPAGAQPVEAQRQAHREALIHGPLEQNAAMRQNAQAHLPQANAAAAAAGAPVQEQAPAKQTYKQRKEQERKAKEARKQCPVGTAETYDCVESISTVLQERKTSMKPYLERATDADVDIRVLGSFCWGHKTNRWGKPATPGDQARADRDKTFLEAYLSKDLEKRKPYLEAFRRELMDFPLSADTMSDAYMMKNAEKLKRITDKSCYYENVMKDPINRPFFEGMDPTELDLLNKKLDAFSKLGGYFNIRLAALGVSTNEGKHYDYERAVAIPAYQTIAGEKQEETRAAVTGWEQEKLRIVQRHVEQEAAAERQRILDGIGVDRQEQEEHLPEDMHFTVAPSGYATEELKRYRTMIEDNPGLYQLNKERVDQLYRELFRGLDIVNELLMDSRVYQAVVDDNNMFPNNATKRAKTAQASRKQEALMRSIDAARKRLDVVGQSLDHLLRGKPLTDDARALLERMGNAGGAAAEGDAD